MSAARAAILKVISEVISRAGAILALPVLTRFEGAAGYGAYLQVFTIFGVIVPFVSLGLTSAVIRYFSAPVWSKELRNVLIYVVLIVSIFSSIVITVFAFEAHAVNELILNWNRGEELLIVSSILILIICLEQLIGNFFRARQWFSQLFILDVAQGTVTILAVLVFIPQGLGLIKLFIAISVLRALIVIFSYLSLWWWNCPTTNINDQVPKIGTMLIFGLPTIIAGFGLSLMHFSGRLVIGHYLDSEYVGYFGALYGLASLLVVINSAFLQTMYPRLLVAFDRNDLENVVRTIKVQLRYSTLALFPSAALMVLISSPLLLYLTKQTFPIDTMTIMLIVFSIFLDQYCPAPQYVLLCKNQTKYKQYCWIAGGLLNLLLCIAFIPEFGLRGAALAAAISMLTLELAMVFKASRIINLSSLFNFDSTIRSLLATTFSTILVIYFYGEILPTSDGLIGVIVSFSTAYIFALFCLGEIRYSDFQILRSAISRGN